MRQRGLVCLLLSCWCALSSFVLADTVSKQERVELKFWQVPKEVRRNVRLAYPFHLYRDWAKEGAIYSVRIISTDYQIVYFDSTGEWLRAYRPVRWSELPYSTYLFLKSEFKAYRMLRAYLVQRSDDLAYYSVEMEHRKIYSLISHMEFDFVGNLTMLDGEAVGSAAEEPAAVATPTYVHGVVSESLLNPNWREANADVYDAAVEDAAWREEAERVVAVEATVAAEVSAVAEVVDSIAGATEVVVAAVAATAASATVTADTVVVDTSVVAAAAAVVAVVAKDTASGLVGTRPVASETVSAGSAADTVKPAPAVAPKPVARDTVKPTPVAPPAPKPAVVKPTTPKKDTVVRDTVKFVRDTIKAAPTEADTIKAVPPSPDTTIAPVQDSAALAAATAPKKNTGPQYMIPFPNFLISAAEVLDSVSKVKALALADTASSKPIADTATTQTAAAVAAAEPTPATTSASEAVPAQTAQPALPDTVICPELVLQNIKKRFPATEKMAWHIADSLYVASFSQAGQDMMAAYREDGMHIYTAYAFSRNEMPLPIDRYLETEAHKMKMSEGWHVMYESKYKRMFAVADRPKDYYYVVMGQKIPKTKTWQYTRFTFNQNAQIESKSTYEKSSDK